MTVRDSAESNSKGESLRTTVRESAQNDGKEIAQNHRLEENRSMPAMLSE